MPNGVDLIPDNENVHFSSVLAYHTHSRTLHVDDTLMMVKLPRLMALCGMRDYVGLHPTLAQALEKRAGATTDFRLWLESLAQQCSDAENLCAAHSAALTAQENQGDSIAERITKSLRLVKWTLARHEKKYG